MWPCDLTHFLWKSGGHIFLWSDSIFCKIQEVTLPCDLITCAIKFSKSPYIVIYSHFLYNSGSYLTLWSDSPHLAFTLTVPSLLPPPQSVWIIPFSLVVAHFCLECNGSNFHWLGTSWPSSLYSYCIALSYSDLLLYLFSLSTVNVFYMLAYKMIVCAIVCDL